MSFKFPKFLIKKIFPPKKCVKTVDTEGDGKADALIIEAINVIQPFTVPETIDLGEFDMNDFDLSEYALVLLDDEPIDISKDLVDSNFVQENVKIFHKGEEFSLEDLLEGKAGGRLIAVGDPLKILLKLEKKYLNQLGKGKHTLVIEPENIPRIEVGFFLTKKNMNVPFEP